jgi:hypothetical protein
MTVGKQGLTRYDLRDTLSCAEGVMSGDQVQNRGETASIARLVSQS